MPLSFKSNEDEDSHMSRTLKHLVQGRNMQAPYNGCESNTIHFIPIMSNTAYYITTDALLKKYFETGSFILSKTQILSRRSCN